MKSCEFHPGMTREEAMTALFSASDVLRGDQEAIEELKKAYESVLPAIIRHELSDSQNTQALTSYRV